MKRKAVEGARVDRGSGRLAVIYRDIGELTPNPKNPRVHSPRQLKQLARSIEAFGFVTPILVDAQSGILAGHGRVLAAKQLGLTHVPTITLDYLSEAQVRALSIADNRLSELATWDDKLLAEELHALSVADLHFELEVTGFETGEIDLRIESLSCSAEDERADKVPAVAGPAITRSGDCWQLDEHRLLCASALDESAYEQLLEGEKADLAFTDPPFNLPVERMVSGFGSNQHRDFQMGSGEMTEAQFTAFLTTSCTQMARHSRPGAVLFACMDWRHLIEMHHAGRAAGFELINLCVWAKQSAGMGSFYRSQYELIFVFRNGRTRHRNNVQLGRFGRDRSNLWSYEGAAGLRVSDEGNLPKIHPTVKPAAMVADAIMDVSSRGDIVLDPFIGSGTTIIAAARTGRRCFGLEIDPLFCDVAVHRWQTFTRGRAVHVSSGRSFDELSREREEADGH